MKYESFLDVSKRGDNLLTWKRCMMDDYHDLRAFGEDFSGWETPAPGHPELINHRLLLFNKGDVEHSLVLCLVEGWLNKVTQELHNNT